MHVMVLGGGVIGVSCAYQLARAGHAVTVVDRCTASAMETSYANAGEVSPGYSAPWAGPGGPMMAVWWLLMHHRPLVIRPNVDWAMLRWGLAMLRNCTAARYEVNKGRMVRLAEYSRDCLRELRDHTGIEYDQRTQGTLQLFRTRKQLDGSAADKAILRQYGVAHELLDVEACLRHEPALAAVRDKFLGGLQLPGDETGDCFKFSPALAALAAHAGVTFRHAVRIERLLVEGGAVQHVVTGLFPRGGDVARAEFWCGPRPMTPEGTPLLGHARPKGLYLATGHGTLGWTMAAGTARVMADVIGSSAPQIDLDGLTIERYRRAA